MGEGEEGAEDVHYCGVVADAGVSLVRDGRWVVVGGTEIDILHLCDVVWHSGYSSAFWWKAVGPFEEAAELCFGKGHGYVFVDWAWRGVVDGCHVVGDDPELAKEGKRCPKKR